MPNKPHMGENIEMTCYVIRPIFYHIVKGVKL